jgi:hypothetical protein
MLPMLVGFPKTRVEGSGYRQKAADQPFNLLKIAGVTARRGLLADARGRRSTGTVDAGEPKRVRASAQGKQSSKAITTFRLHCDRFR